MTSSKILLLSLIALSCFQIQNARVIPADVSDNFNEAIDALHKKLEKNVGPSIILIQLSQKAVLVATGDYMDSFNYAMDQIANYVNSQLRQLDVSQTCRNKGAIAIANSRSTAESNVGVCLNTHKEENEEVGERGINALLELMRYRATFVEQFNNCTDDDCRNEVLEETKNATDNVEKEVGDSLRITLIELMKLPPKFEDVCLMKNEQDYYDQALGVITETEKCLDV